MPTLRNMSRLGLILIAALTGCGEGDAFDPFNKPASSYRELSFLSKTGAFQTMGCTKNLSGKGLSISFPNGTTSCSFPVETLAFPSYSGAYRVKSGIISNQPSTTFVFNYSLSVDKVPLFTMNITPQLRSVDNFSVEGNSAKLTNSTKVDISISYENTDNNVNASPVIINKLSFEFDVPTPAVGSL